MNSRIILLMLSAAIAAPAETFTVLQDFQRTNGAQPWHMTLVQGLDGNLYGTTNGGGAQDGGVIFKVAPNAKLTVIHSLCSPTDCPDGSGLDTGLMLAADGSFYGTTNYGGANGYGTVYRITPNGTLTTVYAFTASDSQNATLVEGTDGNIYGTAEGGGAAGLGSIFQLTPGGAFTTLYSFCTQTNCPDGNVPVAGLLLGADGDFYGTTIGGGANNHGTVFKFSPPGTLTTLYNFCSQANCADGDQAFGKLVQGGDRNFYGTTISILTGGNTVYKITPEGALTTLYTFCLTCSAGGAPVAGLVQGTDGNFYGTTAPPATSTGIYGTIYKIDREGQLTFLHSFNFTDGSTPYGGLVQGTDGKFYGVTTYGGTPAFGAYGTVFSLSLNLGPFVTSLPAFGKAGATIKILGSDLTGATAVTFNGVPAAFTILSKTEISATVPAGATTGTLQLTTPARTLLSNVAFRVGTH